MHRNPHPVLVLMLLGLLSVSAGTARADAAEPNDADAAAGAPTTAPTEAQTEDVAAPAADEAPARRWGRITVIPGYQTTNVDGSAARAGLYVRPFSSFVLSLRDVDLFYNDFDVLDARALDLFGDRWNAYTSLWLPPWLPGEIRGDWQRAEFFAEPYVQGNAWSSRDSQRYQLRLHPFTRTTITADYRDQHVDLRNLGRVARQDWDAQDYNVGLGFSLGPGKLTFDAGGLDFSDRTGDTRDSNTVHVGVGYDAMFGRQLAVGGRFRWANLDLAGPGQDSEFWLLGLYALYQPSNRLSLQARYRYRNIDLGPTLNAYTTASSGAEVSAAYRLSPRLRVQGGMAFTSYERLNALQSRTEHPNETRLWARADYLGGRDLRASLRYEFRTLNNLDRSVEPFVFDSRPLFIDREHRLDARASMRLGQSGLLYGFWQNRLRQLDARDMSHLFGMVGVGASYPVLPTVNVTGDLYYHYYNLNFDPVSGQDADSTVFHLGANWLPARDWAVNADYHRMDIWNGSDADQDAFGFRVSWAFAANQALELGYRMEDYTNGSWPFTGYDLDLLRLNVQTSF